MKMAVRIVLIVNIHMVFFLKSLLKLIINKAGKKANTIRCCIKQKPAKILIVRNNVIVHIIIIMMIKGFIFN